MKIRIKGNAVRFRLTKSDVTKLCDTGCLEDHTSFPENKFTYALQVIDAGEISASFIDGKITVYIPAALITGWSENNLVGFDSHISLTGTDSLYLLVEKDFICIDKTTEDQYDNYENPNKTC